MLLTEIEKIENGRIFTKDEGLFECPHCKSTFAKNFAKDKMRRWGKDKQMFYTTKHCPNCDRRILMKDQNKDVLQRKIERLRQYANQCRITGDLEEYREALKEIANLEAEFRSLIDNLTIKDAESVALNQIGNLKKSIAKDTALRSLDSLKKSMKRKTKDNEETKQYKEGYLVGVREKTRGLTQPPYFGTKEREDWINGYLKGYADSHNSKDSKTKDGTRHYHVEKYANEKYYVEDPAGGDETGPFPSAIMAQREMDKRNDEYEKKHSLKHNNLLKDSKPTAKDKLLKDLDSLRKDMKRTKDAGKVEVKRQSDVGSNQWGIYVNGKLIEGGFFSKEAAEENASKNYGGAEDTALRSLDSLKRSVKRKTKDGRYIVEWNGRKVELEASSLTEAGEKGRAYWVKRNGGNPIFQVFVQEKDKYMKNINRDSQIKDAAAVALKGLGEVRKQMKDRKTKDDVLISHYKGYMITTNGNKFQATNTVRQIDAFSKEELYRKVDDIEEKRAKMREINRRNADSKTKDTWIDEYKGYKIVVKEFGSNTFEFTIQKNGKDVYKGVKETLLGARATAQRLIDQNKVSDSKTKDEDKIEAYGVKGNSNSKWRRIFNNRAEMMKWVESNNAEIQGTRKAEVNERVGNVDRKMKDSYNYKGKDYSKNELWNELVKEGNIKRFGELTEEEKKIKGDRFAIYQSSTGGLYAVTRDTAKDKALKALDSLKRAIGIKDEKLLYSHNGFIIKKDDEGDFLVFIPNKPSGIYFKTFKGAQDFIFSFIKDPIIKDSISIGKHNDIPDDQFNAEELAMGIKIEMEHTTNPDIAKEIAKDHLSEISDYYTRLTKMEEEAKKEKES